MALSEVSVRIHMPTRKACRCGPLERFMGLDPKVETRLRLLMVRTSCRLWASSVRKSPVKTGDYPLAPGLTTCQQGFEHENSHEPEFRCFVIKTGPGCSAVKISNCLGSRSVARYRPATSSLRLIPRASVIRLTVVQPGLLRPLSIRDRAETVMPASNASCS